MRFNYLDKETVVTTTVDALSAGTLKADAYMLTAPTPGANPTSHPTTASHTATTNSTNDDTSTTNTTTTHQPHSGEDKAGSSFRRGHGKPPRPKGRHFLH